MPPGTYYSVNKEAFTGLWGDINSVVPVSGVVHDFGIFLSLLSIIFLVLIAYLGYRIRELWLYEWARFTTWQRIASEHAQEKSYVDFWNAITEHLASQSPSDWKLAILEADNLLDQLTKNLAHEGETLGERLKSLHPSDMKTLDLAWEAHRFRNRVAHEGALFNVSQGDARRIIGLYGQVFREFGYI